MKNKKTDTTRLDVRKSQLTDMPTVPNTATTPSSKVKSDWKDWLALNGPKLLLFARQQTRSQHDAEDVLQDALIRLAQKVEQGTFQGDEDNWLPYLYTSIRRLSIDLGRHEDRRRRREEKSYETESTLSPHEVPDTHWFEAAGADDEIQQMLSQELKNLPSKFAEVINLKIWGDMTFQQIADTLQISINTVASRYRYGLDHLKKSLQKHHDAYQR